MAREVVGEGVAVPVCINAWPLICSSVQPCITFSICSPAALPSEGGWAVTHSRTLWHDPGEQHGARSPGGHRTWREFQMCLCHCWLWTVRWSAAHKSTCAIVDGDNFFSLAALAVTQQLLYMLACLAAEKCKYFVYERMGNVEHNIQKSGMNRFLFFTWLTFRSRFVWFLQPTW